MNVWRQGRSLVTLAPARFAVVTVLWIIYITIPVLMGLVLRQVFDLLGAGTAGSRLTSALAVLVGLTAGRAVAQFYANVASAGVFSEQSTLLQRNALASLVHSGLKRGSLPASSGDAISRLHGDTREVVRFVDTWVDVAGAGLFAIAAITIMVTVSPLATAVAVLPLAAITVATRALSPRIRAYRITDRAAAADLQAFIAELYGGALAVKVARAEDAMLRRFDAIGEQRRRAALRDRLLTDLLETLNGSTVNVAIGLMLLVLALRSGANGFSVGDLALFVAYIDRLAFLPRMLGRLGVRAQQAAVSLERLGALMPPGESHEVVAHAPTYVRADPPAQSPDARALVPLDRLEVRGLTLVHANGGGIRGANLSLRRGTFTVITGPVGAGKTTLLRALLGLTTPQEGTVAWNGQVIQDLAALLVPPHCAYLPQAPRLFSESLAGNIALGAVTDDEVLAAVELAALGPDVRAMPEGLATVVGSRGVRLSGGQIQRAAAARAFVRRPDLLVIDDLSSALDTRTEQQLWQRLTSDTSLTCLLVSSRRAAWERADNIVLVHDGQILETGNLAQLQPRHPYLQVT